ncbi:hypothetical protein PV390_14215 [Streptomyces sp. ME02-6991-2A]|uniref:hypothetical protein n=1 Tax=Streptomyces sp. ME02-6991-2A TaxID=3028677 RepID=UPI00211AAC2E|nr:hypothetical protein [Streptomyces sp. ME02-6991-2A]MDX3375553.1 hypothetical protein [Streptomyces sp. ME02-6991-2A]
MALSATTLITAAAATEYEHYVEAREELRRPALSSSVSAPGSADPGAMALTGGRRNYETSGAGMVAVVMVLAPMLAGAVAVLSLSVGFILKMLDPESAFAQILLTTGWFSGAAAGAAILVAIVGLLVTALRAGSTYLPAEKTEDELPEEVARAREAWRHALLERGILPFLRDALSDPTAGPAPRTSRPAGIPDTGYSRPDFSSADRGRAARPRLPVTGPEFTSPPFTGPDFTGPTESTLPTGHDQSD